MNINWEFLKEPMWAIANLIRAIGYIVGAIMLAMGVVKIITAADNPSRRYGGIMMIFWSIFGIILLLFLPQIYDSVVNLIPGVSAPQWGS